MELFNWCFCYCYYPLCICSCYQCMHMRTFYPPDGRLSKLILFQFQPGLSSTFDFDSEDEEINTLVGTPGASCDANLPEDVQDVIQPLMKLKINEDHHGTKIDANSFSSQEETSLVSSEERDELVPSPYQNVAVSYNWRSIFSKINIWYGSFGSNMWKSRFLCSIEGGQVRCY